MRLNIFKLYIKQCNSLFDLAANNRIGNKSAKSTNWVWFALETKNEFERFYKFSCSCPRTSLTHCLSYCCCCCCWGVWKGWEEGLEAGPGEDAHLALWPTLMSSVQVLKCGRWRHKARPNWIVTLWLIKFYVRLLLGYPFPPLLTQHTLLHSSCCPFLASFLAAHFTTASLWKTMAEKRSNNYTHTHTHILSHTVQGSRIDPVSVMAATRPAPRSALNAHLQHVFVANSARIHVLVSVRNPHPLRIWIPT